MSPSISILCNSFLLSAGKSIEYDSFLTANFKVDCELAVWNPQKKCCITKILPGRHERK